jgi:hypothetical protein
MASLFVVGSVASGFVDYLASGVRSIWVPAGLGIGCGVILVLVARRCMEPYRRD